VTISEDLPPPAPSAGALATALAAEGLSCDVEVRGRLAVLLPGADAGALADPARRRRAAALAAAHGFSHVALELAPAEDDAR
jgi:hypothetical protein